MISNVRVRKPRVVRIPAHQFVTAQMTLAAVAGLLVVGRVVSLVVQLTPPLPSATIFDEDAYYVFSVARNLARGHGVTADGAQWTNGFQPLWTFIATLPYLIFTDDRLALGSIALLSIAIWLGSAYLFVRLVGRLIGDHALPGWTKWAIAVMFVADLQVQAHFFNGLETGLHSLCILALLVWIERVVRIRSAWQWIGVGAALGVLILARNDGIFLAVALLIGAAVANRSLAGLRNVVLVGGTMCGIVAPWLGFNMWLNGTPMPQSGIATNSGPYASPLSLYKVWSMAERLAQLTFTPFPLNSTRFQENPTPVTGLLAFAAIAICCLLIRRQVSLGRAVRTLWPLAVAVAALSVYYVVGSGAVWMYDRYLIPYKLLSLVLWALVFAAFAKRARPAVSLVLTLAIVGLSVYYQLESSPMGSNITSDMVWVESSPLAQTASRIGMFESGRTGYVLADRVENLDGKVNLAALRAMQRGEFLNYLDHSDIDVLVFGDYFEPWLDANYPDWRLHFVPEPTDVEGLLLARRTLASREGATQAPAGSRYHTDE